MGDNQIEAFHNYLDVIGEWMEPIKQKPQAVCN
jgi:hypothetical protein